MLELSAETANDSSRGNTSSANRRATAVLFTGWRKRRTDGAYLPTRVSFCFRCGWRKSAMTCTKTGGTAGRHDVRCFASTNHIARCPLYCVRCIPHLFASSSDTVERTQSAPTTQTRLHFRLHSAAAYRALPQTAFSVDLTSQHKVHLRPSNCFPARVLPCRTCLNRRLSSPPSQNPSLIPLPFLSLHSPHLTGSVRERDRCEQPWKGGYEPSTPLPIRHPCTSHQPPSPRRAKVR